jgi:hypothetical protein
MGHISTGRVYFWNSSLPKLWSSFELAALVPVRPLPRFLGVDLLDFGLAAFTITPSFTMAG